MNNDQLSKAGFILASSWLQNKETLFTGTAYLESAIIIGSEGYEKYSREHGEPDISDMQDGRFSIIRTTETDCIARSDCLGQDFIFYFFDGRNWAISNSLLWLTRHLHEYGVTLTANADTVDLWKIPHPITHGPVSNDTFINEIRTLPSDAMLHIVQHGERFSLDVVRVLDPRNIENICRDEYISLLINYASKSASRSNALLNYYGSRAKVDVTGGLDSRLILGLIAASEYPLKNINFHSNPRYSEDYAAAESLSSTLGFSIKNHHIPTSLSSTEYVYDLWKIGCAGVYSPLYIPHGDEMQTAIHFHGACGECYRDYYSADAAKISSKIDALTTSRETSLAFSRQLGKALAEIGEGARSISGMAAHYRHFRSRSHFGRSAYKNLNRILISPLASSDLLRAFQHLSIESIRESQLALDLLLLTCPKLATQPFDKVHKNFKKDAFERSPFFANANKNLLDLQTVAVYAPDIKAPSSNGDRTPFTDMLLIDLKDSADLAVSTGIFTREDVELAATRVSNGERLVYDGMLASHIISISEFAKLANFNKVGTPAKRIKSDGIKLKSKLVNNSVIVEACNSTEYKDKYEYAFYLLSGNARIGLRWYKDLPYAEFTLGQYKANQKLAVKAFRREKNNHSNKTSKLIYINI